jgi:hypothetical protein
MASLVSFRGLFRTGNRLVLLLALAAGLEARLLADDIQLPSKWDQELLTIELGSVNIKAYPADGFRPSIVNAWEQITATYLIRANIYVDLKTAIATEKRHFEFKKEKATGKELFDAFLAAYPEYTYTRDPRTAVIWLHAKDVKYDEILKAREVILRPELQVPMLSGALEPLFKLLYPKPRVDVDLTGRGPFNGNPLALLAQYNNSVDLPAGIYSARDVLNFCCLSSPSLAFWAFEENENGRVSLVVPSHLVERTPSAAVRPGAIRFWETEIGDTTNAPPSPDALAAALSDANPRKRWAAREYHKATREVSHGIVSADPRIVVWQCLAWKAVDAAGFGDARILKVNKVFADKKPAILNDLMRLDPGAALVTSMELARETKEADVMEVVSGHKFTEAEIAAIKPDVYRIARESKLVRDKLLQMKFDAPELSQEALKELGNTNLFILAPDDKIR